MAYVLLAKVYPGRRPMAAHPHADKLVSDLAKEAGVPVEAAGKVLKALGLDALVANVSEAAGSAGVTKLSVGNLKLAARIGRSSVAV
jgi:hypothetical protein